MRFVPALRTENRELRTAFGTRSTCPPDTYLRYRRFPRLKAPLQSREGFPKPSVFQGQVLGKSLGPQTKWFFWVLGTGYWVLALALPAVRILLGQSYIRQHPVRKFLCHGIGA